MTQYILDKDRRREVQIYISHQPPGFQSAYTDTAGHIFIPLIRLHPSLVYR